MYKLLDSMDRKTFWKIQGFKYVSSIRKGEDGGGYIKTSPLWVIMRFIRYHEIYKGLRSAFPCSCKVKNN